MRSEYQNVHDRHDYTQAPGAKFSVSCPIAHAGYGLDLITGELVGYLPELQAAVVWDFTKFKHWKGPQHTTDIVDILKMEDVLPQEFFLSIQPDTQQKTDSVYTSVGKALVVRANNIKEFTNKAAIAFLLNDIVIGARITNFVKDHLRVVHIANTDGAVQEHYHWISVSLSTPNTLRNGDVGWLVANPHAIDFNFKEYTRRLSAIRKDPEDS